MVTPPAAALRVLCLCTVALWILELNLLPFELAPDLLDVQRRAAEAAQGPWSRSAIRHAALFVPFGLLLAVGARWRPRRALWVVAGLALVVELAQCAVRDRHPRLGDAVMHCLGGLAGLAIGAALRSWVRGRLAQPGRGLPRVLFLAGTVACSAVPLMVPAVVPLADWDPGYPLTVGDEADGSRPFTGRVSRLALYRGRLADGAIRQLARSPWTPGALDGERRRQGLVLAYEPHGPDGLGVRPELSSGGPERNLVPRAGRYLATAADELAPVWRSLADAAAFTLEVAVEFRDLTADGPARIVSASADALARNFTLGQSRRDLVFRVRNPVSGPNGLRFQGRWRDVVRPGRPVHLIAIYDRGDLRLYVDGALVEPVQSLARQNARWTPGWSGRGAFLAILWFLPIAWAAALGFGTGWRTLALVLAVSWLPFCIADVVASGRLGTGAAPGLYAAAVLAVLIGWRLGRWN